MSDCDVEKMDSIMSQPDGAIQVGDHVVTTTQRQPISWGEVTHLSGCGRFAVVLKPWGKKGYKFRCLTSTLEKIGKMEKVIKETI